MKTLLAAILSALSARSRPTAGQINVALHIIETTNTAKSAPRPVPVGFNAH